MCFSNDVARVVLVTVNTIFLLLGLSVAILGFVLRYGESLYEPFLDEGLEKLKTVLKDTNLDSFDVANIEIKEVLSGLATGLILGGLFLCSVSLLGCCGACYKAKTMLWIYAIVILVFVIAEGVSIGILYGSPEIVKDRLKGQLSDYAGLGSSEVFSLGWNVIMIQFKCCGVDSYADFDRTASSSWNQITVGVNTYTLDTPIACCKTLPATQVLDNCAVSPFTRGLSNYDKGCYETIWDYSLGNTSIAIPILVVCAVIQMTFFISAIVIAKSTDTLNKVVPF